MADRVHTATQMEDGSWSCVIVQEDTPEGKVVFKIWFSNKGSSLLSSIKPTSPIGSGKSVAVVTAIRHGLDPNNKNLQAICIVGTKDSAKQIHKWLLKKEVEEEHGRITCYLGIPPEKDNYEPLNKMKPKEAQVIVGTPRTIHNLIVAKKFVVKDTRTLLIYDVDLVLAEPGYRDLVVKIKKDISKKSLQCQVIMCSNIVNDAMKAFLSKMEVPTLPVKQYKVNCDNRSKIDCIKNILSGPEIGQAIIYVHTEQSAITLHESLGNPNSRLTSRLRTDNEKRDKEDFEQMRFQFLISTKILDWEFDKSKDGLVVFFDLSIWRSHEQYSRYIDRAGQFGHKGGAVCNLMCGDKDKKMMENIEIHNHVTEVRTEEQFEDALKKAGL